jgi:Protein of unknown function (DUF2905)
MAQELGRGLILLGVLLIVIGGVFLLAGKIPWLGRLPGDIVIERKHFSLYFPLATSLILSVVLSFLFWFFTRR